MLDKRVESEDLLPIIDLARKKLFHFFDALSELLAKELTQ